MNDPLRCRLCVGKCRASATARRFLAGWRAWPSGRHLRGREPALSLSKRYPPRHRQTPRSRTICFPTRRTPLCAGLRAQPRSPWLKDFKGCRLRPQPARFDVPGYPTGQSRAIVSTSGSSGMKDSLQCQTSVVSQDGAGRLKTRRLFHRTTALRIAHPMAAGL